MFERLMHTIGREELIDDPYFKTNTDRVKNNHLLDRIVSDFILARTQEECLEIFEKANVTVGAVADVAQLMESRYVKERGALVDLPDKHTTSGRMSATPAKIRTEAPDIGEHNSLIYGEIGLSEAEISALQADGVL